MFSEMKDLYTIGYEGVTKEDFLRNLKRNHISMLVDVREIPISRKRGFSKSALMKELNENGIEYVHIKKLGSPTAIRNRLKEDHDYDRFFKDYTDYLVKCSKHELAELYNLVTKKRACLMCYERDSTRCHRSVVAKKVSRLNGLKIGIHHL